MTFEKSLYASSILQVIIGYKNAEFRREFWTELLERFCVAVTIIANRTDNEEILPGVGLYQHVYVDHTSPLSVLLNTKKAGTIEVPAFM